MLNINEKAGIQNSRCKLVSGDDISFMECKVKTVIDSLVLSEKQEKTTKDVLQTVYGIGSIS